MGCDAHNRHADPAVSVQPVDSRYFPAMPLSLPDRFALSRMRFAPCCSQAPARRPCRSDDDEPAAGAFPAVISDCRFQAVMALPELAAIDVPAGDPPVWSAPQHSCLAIHAAGSPLKDQRCIRNVSSPAPTCQFPATCVCSHTRGSLRADWQLKALDRRPCLK